jgi:hypothetical protein
MNIPPPIWNNESNRVPGPTGASGPTGPVGPTGPGGAGSVGPTGPTGPVATNTLGGWHRTTTQPISTIGAPSFVAIVWQASSYGDTTTISQNAPNSSNFTINQNGIYLLGLQIQYSALSGATLTDRTLRAGIAITRGGNTASVLQSNYDFIDNTPTAPAIAFSGMYELLAGDILSIQLVQYLSAGSFNILGQSAAPLDFDYNTFWNWTLLKSLP